jgi:hypothetical protein
MHGHGYGRTTVDMASAGNMMVKVKVTVQVKGASRPHSEGRRKLWLVPVAQVALARHRNLLAPTWWDEFLTRAARTRLFSRMPNAI